MSASAAPSPSCGPDESSLSKESQCRNSFLADFIGGHISLSTVVQFVVSMMPMVREVLCSNPGPDKKNVGTKINSWPILRRVG